MELLKVKTEILIPYDRNPRQNEGAIEAVAESIKQCDYISPIIVDENMVILAGHTRLKALQYLGIDECEVIIKEGLTEEQKKKYRILDNKTGELATWDIDLLNTELEDIDFEGFDFGFGIETEEEEEPQTDEAPEDFKEYGEDIETEHKCPMCGYEW